MDAGELAEAIREAAAAVRLTVDLPAGPVVLRFGEQTDTQPINTGQDGALTPERVAGYIAKYAVAVGTALTGGPPHRSPHAELPHGAPASGSGGEAHLREWMRRAGSR